MQIDTGNRRSGVFINTRLLENNGNRQLLTDRFRASISEERASSLRTDEIRWHYSQHFLAEKNGENVIEDMLLLATNEKQRSILHSQLRDEKMHAALFARQIDRIGLDERANRYADGYEFLVKEQKTFSEKVFVFQILTEAISAGYCDWRIDHISDSKLNELDQYVAADERRHLKMGKALLEMCESEEIEKVLTRKKQTDLIRAMNDLCGRTVRVDMFSKLLDGDEIDQSNFKTEHTSLDRYVSRAVIQEHRKLKAPNGITRNVVFDEELHDLRK